MNSESAFKPRGLVRTLILLVLHKGPTHGYQIMDEIERLTGHRPSAGEIYPFLKRLVEEGYLQVMEERKRRKVYKLTDKGVKLVEDTVDRMASIVEAIVESKLDVCANCGVKIYEGGVEITIEGKKLRFCCEHCAANFFAKKGIEKPNFEHKH